MNICIWIHDTEYRTMVKKIMPVVIGKKIFVGYSNLVFP